MRRLAIIGAFLASCGVRHNAKPDATPLDELDAKASRYALLMGAVQDDNGAVDTYECNSLQRTGLVCAAGGTTVRVRLEAFEDVSKPGRMYRRPTSYPECFSSGASRSTISPDDLLGAFWCGWKKQDAAILERIYDYGHGRGWAMGDDAVGGANTLLRPHEIATLASVIYGLGGKEHGERRYHPPTWVPGCEGYVCALRIYEILLRGQVEGKITDADIKELKHAASRQQRNPLAQFAWHLYSDGDQSRTRELLMDDAVWPNDRLPTSADRCDAWIIQRDDDSSGYRPCDEGHTHSGGDFLFVYSLLVGGTNGRKTASQR